MKSPPASRWRTRPPHAFRSALALLAVVWLTGCGTRVIRTVRWMDADMNDIHRFPLRTIPNGGAPFAFAAPTPGQYDTLFTPVTMTQDGTTTVQDFDAFLAGRDTWAFLVIRRDTLLVERYFGNGGRDSVATTFSIAKSLVSIAVGVAIDSGWIRSVQDPITQYLPELAERDTRFIQVTIEHLLTMMAGVQFGRGKTPWGDEARSYYDPNLRRVALSRQMSDAPGSRFAYNPYNPIILGLALERTSKRPLTQLLSEAVWTRLGANHPTSWSLDSRSSGFEKMESGFNATALDLAKLGRLFLRNGDWDGDRILNPDWVRASVRPDSIGGRPRYGYFWWVRPTEGEADRYYAEGRFGQFIYVVPDRDLIIVRTGKTDGDVNWISMFERVVKGVDAVDARDAQPPP